VPTAEIPNVPSGWIDVGCMIAEPRITPSSSRWIHVPHGSRPRSATSRISGLNAPEIVVVPDNVHSISGSVMGSSQESHSPVRIRCASRRHGCGA
jgi:hypothetical protein